MADENWQKVRKIFDDALRQRPEERGKFVRRACGGNEILLGEVESLLSSFDKAESFLETPAVAKVAEEVLPKQTQFSSGQILGHYSIREQIGAGGMGEVYLARDEKLQRPVALKVVRENLLSDKGAHRRLLREARAAALLDHPHICQIYEISETADCSFIVMQYIVGKTLSEILKTERLSVEKSLDLAIQIADALALAHSRGIIHRDIKPANVMVTDRGTAKVLDFGLAKFIEAEASAETVQRLNSSGAVMGTVPFMSPEQLCCQRLDARTDVFSFGALFYEMLTGRQPFARENNAETISAILNDEPDWSLVPAKLQPILRKSLMKNKDLRYKSAQDLAADLRQLQKEGGFDELRQAVSTSPTEKVVTNESVPPKKRQFYFWQSGNEKFRTPPQTGEVNDKQIAGAKRARFNPSILPSFLVFFSIVGAAILFFWQFNKTDDSRRFDRLRAVQLVSWKAAAGSSFSDYSLSHSGKLIAYSSSQGGGNDGIYVKQTTEGEGIRVTKDEWTNVSPVWSPDDQRLAYSSRRENQTGIYVGPALGGAATLLKIIGQSNVHLRDWSMDGAAIFYEYEGNLFRLDVATREIAQVTDFAADAAANRDFSASPDETRIAFCDKTNGQDDVWTMPLSGGEKRRLTDEDGEKRRPRWHPDGKQILYNVRRGDYQQIGLADADGRYAPVQITRGDSQYEMIDVSADGTKIFYFAFEYRSDISGVKIETGEEFEIAAGREYENWAAPAPDGKSIVYESSVVKQFGKETIIVKQFGNSSPTLSLEGKNPRWLPDSRRISFVRWSETEQKHHLFLANTANGEEKQITTIGTFTPSYSFFPTNRGEIGVEAWSSDGGKFVYINQKSPKNVWMASLETGETVKLTDNESATVRYNSPLFSPNGKRVVFVSRETVAQQMIFGLWIWEDGKTKQIFSMTGGLRLLGWSAAGDEILLETTDGAMKAATPIDVKLLRVALSGESQILTVFKNIYADTMTLSSDGKTLAYTARQNDKDDIWTAAVAGGEPKKITANGSTRLYYASPAWSSDGKTIFFDKQERIGTISMLENFN